MSTYSLEGLIKAFFIKPPKRRIPSAVCTSMAAIDYIANCVNRTALTTVVPSANTLYAYPFWAPSRKSTIGRLAIENTTTNGTQLARIGLYRNVINPRSFYPGDLLVDSGNLALSAAAIQTYASSQELEPNILYWLVFNTDGTRTFRALSVNAISTMLGIATGTSGTANPFNLGIIVASTFGAMPSTYPGSGAYITGTTAQIALRYQFSG